MSAAAVEVLAFLAQSVAAPLAAWHDAASQVEADEIGYDQFDEIRDEAAYLVLETLEAVLEVARESGIIPAQVTA